jgi:hypothetical protein
VDANHADAAAAGMKIGAAWLMFITSTLVPALSALALVLTIVFTSFQIVKIIRDMRRQKRADIEKAATDEFPG